MDELITKFTSLLCYVPYICEEEEKVHGFINHLPVFMKERLEFDNPKTMDEVIHKARICYQQNRPKGDMNKKCNDKKINKFFPGHEGNKGLGRKGIYWGHTNRNFNKNPSRFKVLGEAKTNEKLGRIEAELVARSPLQCWGCRGPNYVKNYPQHRGDDQISQLQEVSIIGEIARSLPKINATLEDCHEKFQPTMVEFEGQNFN